MPDVFDEESGDIFGSGFNLADKTVDPALLGKAHALLKPLMLRRLKVTKRANDSVKQVIVCRD